MIAVNYAPLPKEYRAEALAYVQLGTPPSAFFEAVLANELTQALDFFEAAGRDPYIASEMRDFVATVAWVSEQCPAKARGSRGAVVTWTDRHGLQGMQRSREWASWAETVPADVVNAETPSGLTRATREFMRMIGGRRGY